MSDSKWNDFKKIIEEFAKSHSSENVDIFRETAIRYCGYANEVGESFRPLIPKGIVHFSYAIAITYVIGDCVDKTIDTYKKPEVLGGKRIWPAAKIAGDVFLWQIFASVIIPGFVINRITWGVGKLCKNAKLTGLGRKWTPTCIGLLAIPFIIRPIDSAVDHAMDNTYRKYLS